MMGNRQIMENVVRDMWVQERWRGGGPFPKRLVFHFCQIRGVRRHEMNNMIKPQKTDKCTLSSSQSTLK